MNAARPGRSPHFIESNHTPRNHIVHTSTQQPYNNSLAVVTAMVSLGVLCVVMCAVLSMIPNHDHIYFHPKIKKTRVCRYDTAAVSFVLCQPSANNLQAVYQVLDVYRGLEHAAGLVWLRRWMIDSA